jgi:hypothetical protein
MPRLAPVHERVRVVGLGATQRLHERVRLVGAASSEQQQRDRYARHLTAAQRSDRRLKPAREGGGRWRQLGPHGGAHTRQRLHSIA